MAEEKDYVQEQCTEVCLGELLEDMVDTVERTKKMYCDVWIKDWFTKDSSHPLTYVPLWATSLPLKKGDKVMVAFTNGDFSLPYLWKNPDELEDSFWKKFDLDGGGADIPDPAETVSATKLGEDSFIIKTDDYTVYRQNTGYVLMDKEGNVYTKGKKVQVVSDDFRLLNSNTTKVEAGNKLEVVADKLSIKDSSGSNSLFTILKGMLDVLNNSLTTAGSPANHTVVPSQFQAQAQMLQQLME